MFEAEGAEGIIIRLLTVVVEHQQKYHFTVL